MRLLLISDTHGALDIINELADLAGADAVIHAGDFGFFDDGSFERLSDRELRLHAAHSDLSPSEKTRILQLSRNGLIDAAKEHRLLGNFQAYIDGLKSFQVPVYAVWGNHEDSVVVSNIFRGDLVVENLNILHHRQAYQVGPAFIYGLGGNLLPGSKMLQKPIAGGGGKIWITLSQYSDLVALADKEEESPGPRIFVSHVSPGKEPFVEFLGARTHADFTISGHMGAPTTMVWNAFATSSLQNARKRLQDGFIAMKSACLAASRARAQELDHDLSLIEHVPSESVPAESCRNEPQWYRGMTHINLPDAHVGCALMDVEDTSVKIQTFFR